MAQNNDIFNYIPHAFVYTFEANECRKIKLIQGDTESILGLTESTFVATNWIDLIHPEDLSTYYQIFKSGVYVQKPYHIRYRVKNTVENRYVTIVDKGYVTLNKDVQYVKGIINLAETEFSQNDFQRIFSAIPCLLITLDTHFTVTYSNHQELLPNTTDFLSIIQNQDKKKQLKKLLQTALKTNENQQYEANNLFEIDNEARWYKINITTFDTPQKQLILSIFDISDEKAALFALEQSEEKFKLLSNCTNEYVLIHENGIIQEVNDALCEFVGTSAENIIGKNVLDIASPDTKELIQNSIQHKDYTEYEGVFHTLDNTPFSVRITSKPIIYKGRKARVSISRDISKEKETEKKLLEIKDLLSQAQKLAKLGSWYYDFKEAALVWSEELFTIYDRPLEKGQLTPEEWISFVHPDYKYLNDLFLKNPIKSILPYKNDYKIITENGIVKDIRTEIYPVYDNENNLIRFFGIELDISELKDIQRAMQSSESRFRAITEHTTDITFVVSDNKITYASPSIYSSIGYTADELLNQPLIEYIHPDDRDAFSFIFKESQKHQRKTFFLPFSRFQTKNNEWLYIEALTTYIPDIEGINGFVINCRDISQRIEFENEQARLKSELVQVQKMETIGTLAGGIAHDFKNILMPIIGFTNLVIDELKSEKRDDLIADLEKVLIMADRANSLVKQILTFTYKSETEKKAISLNKIIEETVNLLKATIPSSIEIRYLSKLQDFVIEADSTQIQQVLMNICTNAYQSIKNKSGKINIQTKALRITSNNITKYRRLKLGDYVQISISDNGEGISEEIIDRIFDPFFTTKKVGNGTGLGLSVAMGIIKNHDGSIEVDSVATQGTNFHLFLPLVHKLPSIEKKKNITPGAGEGKVLLVEDEIMTRDLIHRFLTRFGYNVDLVVDGLEALSTLENSKGNYDVIISDQTMPKLSGIELAKRVKNTYQIPFILLSGSAELLELDLSTYGVDEFAMKPIMPNDLINLIAKVLNEKKKDKIIG